MRRALLLACAILVSAAEPKKPAPGSGPKITLATHLGIAPGVKTRLVLRGAGLEGATEVRCRAAKSTTKLLGKSNGQIEAEVQLPADVAGETVNVTVVTPKGESAPYSLFVERTPPVLDKEPNNGFATAQALTVPGVAHGAIDHGWDVDTYRFEGKAGQKLVCEVHAARHGSALDSLLTLYDANRQVVATNDDHNGGPDSRLEVTLPRTGTYYVSVGDANDQNGPTHVYRLTVRGK
jgi:hypothetical protein